MEQAAISTSVATSEPRVAVLVPCRDEEATVADVVAGFLASLPGCVVYVYDNGSVDATAARATEAGAVVRTEEVPGKGGVVRRMFAEVDADIYVMADGSEIRMSAEDRGGKCQEIPSRS